VLITALVLLVVGGLVGGGALAYLLTRPGETDSGKQTTQHDDDTRQASKDGDAKVPDHNPDDDSKMMKDPDDLPEGSLSSGHGRIMVLLRNENVKKELKLTNEQFGKVLEVLKKFQGDFTKRDRSLPLEERERLTTGLDRNILQDLVVVLTKEQLLRLQQIELQSAGVAAYNRPSVQLLLKLTADQKNQVKKINTDTEDHIKGRKLTFAQVNARRQEGLLKIQGLLTAEQKKVWSQQTGDPVSLGGRLPKN
jgi:hypothetical protein